MHHSAKCPYCIISFNPSQHPRTQLLLSLSPLDNRENWDAQRFFKKWLKGTKQVNTERLKTQAMGLLNHAFTCKATGKKHSSAINYLGELGYIIPSSSKEYWSKWSLMCPRKSKLGIFQMFDHESVPSYLRGAHPRQRSLPGLFTLT